MKVILPNEGFYSVFLPCHFNVRYRKRRVHFWTLRWLSTVFCISKFRYDLGFQSRDKWSLNNYDAIEITSKLFYASSVTIPYIQNLTSTLKLRSALFSWLVLVLFLAMRKVTALSGGFPLQTWWPEKSCHLYINSLPCHPLLIIGKRCYQFFHSLIIGSINDLSKDNCC